MQPYAPLPRGPHLGTPPHDFGCWDVSLMLGLGELAADLLGERHERSALGAFGPVALALSEGHDPRILASLRRARNSRGLMLPVFKPRAPAIS